MKSEKLKSAKRSNRVGIFLERMLFDNRPLVLAIFMIITVFLGYKALQLRPEASFLRMIPTYHPYIKNYIMHQDDLKGLGNVVRIAVETTEGDIFTEAYLEVLQKINDEIFYIPGVDRGALKSLWTPLTRWTEVTQDGFAGGPVIPDTYNGSQASLEQVRINLLKSGEIGTLVANNFKSSSILVPLLDVVPETGEPLDYKLFSGRLESLVRQKYESDGIQIHITGFAKIVGDLIQGSTRVFLFFLIAFMVLLLVLFYNSRCWRSTLMRGLSSMVAVAWQLGFLCLLGYGLNPYSMLVPFLMFALGVSHGIQMYNAMAHEMLGGADKLTAARRSYRTVYIPGLAALLTDCIGFATLFVIRIGVIQDIAIGASIGVAVVAFTDLMLLPVLMSYSGISNKTIERLREKEAGPQHILWRVLASFTQTKMAIAAILVGVIGLGVGFYVRQDLKIGDLDPGASELRPDSPYNRDNAFMNSNYSMSSDVFVVMLKTPEAGNSIYNAVYATDRLKWRLKRTEGVQDVMSYVGQLKLLNAAFNEGNMRWMAIPRSKAALDNMVLRVPVFLASKEGDLSPILIYLEDHKAETLERIVATVEDFAAANNTDDMQFIMAAGNAGIEAATNIEIAKAQLLMMVLVYSVVFIVCLITYRSLRAAICVVAPLYITSILCEAVMAKMGIGVKVATLPVIAVGVGIGVDYGIYIFNKLSTLLDAGYDLPTAYFKTLKSTGRAVMFTGITMAIGVATWVFSPIKFQADMGLLLTFMFLWNMVGAMVLLPALARFLLKPETQRRAAKSARLSTVA
jgi:uncharacterized protein